MATEDRGDDWTPTDEATDAAAAAAAATAEAAAAATKEADALAALAAKGEPKTLPEGTEPEVIETEGKPKAKDTRLPLARHEEILNRERERRAAVELELAKFQKGTVVADLGKDITEAETVMLALTEEYNKFIVDGDMAKAAEAMTRIRRTERAISEKTSEARIAESEARAVERVRYDMVVERLEDEYPVLNPDHADFDKVITGEILELREAYQLKGYTPGAALQKAVKLIIPPKTVAQTSATEVTPRVDAEAVKAARKAAAVATTADALARTPASTAKTGLNSDAAGGSISAKDVIKMSYKDFAALDETTLASMRGDNL